MAVSCGNESKSNPVTSVTVEPSSLSLSVGETDSIRATVLPETAEDKSITWSSSDESIASVDAEGEVRAIANGIATIIATAVGGKTATCAVKVVPAVYVAGNANIGGIHVARVWKNGKVLYELSDTADHTKYSSASSMFVSSNEVYVAGHVSRASDTGNGMYYIESPVATVWKNGVEQALPGAVEGADSRAESVYVSGSDVYVAGIEMQTGSRIPPVLTVWKNSVPQILPDRIGDIYCSVFVSGNDVYVAGNMAGSTSKMWKNGVEHYTKNATVSSIFVSGNDVYEAGSESSDNFMTIDKVWKNNEELYTLYDSKKRFNARANSIYVSGSDVYVAGCEIRENGFVAMLWKNGTTQRLGGETIPSEASSVFVLGDDVYVAGYARDAATVWKNGDLQVLADAEASSACSIFVK
jgi:hypothetical protein